MKEDLCFNDEERFELLYYETLISNSDLYLKIVELEKIIETLKSELVSTKMKETLLMKQNKIKELGNIKKLNINKLKNRKDELSKKYDVDLEKCGFDDETGLIVILDDQD